MARATRKLDLCPEIEGEGKMWRFAGIWSKNRPEWLMTALACMYVRTASVGLFDAMSNSAVDFIVNQTGLTTFFMSGDYLNRMIEMKKAGFLVKVTNLVVYDEPSKEGIEAAAALGMRVFSWEQMQQEGVSASAKDYPFEETQSRDTYAFSYTSGTTSNPKGVKLTHHMVLSVVHSVMTKINIPQDSRVISYLPYPHSFE